MLISSQMLTGFNTDVEYEGKVYHVQTEDRGKDHPILESLIYMGGSVVAKKLTPYENQAGQDSQEGVIAGLLKRQHQVMIAAIKAGRVGDLIRHSADSDWMPPERGLPESSSRALPPDEEAFPIDTLAGPVFFPEIRDPGPVSRTMPVGSLPTPQKKPKSAVPVTSQRPVPVPAPRAENSPPPVTRVSPAAVASLDLLPRDEPVRPPSPERKAPANVGGLHPLPLDASVRPPTAEMKAPPAPIEASHPVRTAGSGRLALNLDQVISDYLKRSSEQGKLDLKVITPDVFIAGEAIALRIQVSRGQSPEIDASVTVKIIGTAFRPQVYANKSDAKGLSLFNFTLPSFSAGTAALVIEAESKRGRGELKHLIRRA